MLPIRSDLTSTARLRTISLGLIYTGRGGEELVLNHVHRVS